jgi:transposase
MQYPSDLTDSQYALIADLFDVGNMGKSRKHSVRHLLNALFYLTKSGCQWRMLPHDFPPYATVYSFYRRCLRRKIWDKVLERLVEKSRGASGRSSPPTYALIDSQSVKTTHSGQSRGIDGGKKNQRAQKTHCD